MAPSSLQKAASAAARTTNTVKVGAFESCFAQGLDLSEFSQQPQHGSQQQPSASAALLLAKQREAQVKQEQEWEEVKMNQTIQRRVMKMKKQDAQNDDDGALKLQSSHSSAGNNENGNMSMLGNVLANMHKKDKDNISSRDRIKVSRKVKHTSNTLKKTMARKKPIKSK